MQKTRFFLLLLIIIFFSSRAIAVTDGNLYPLSQLADGFPAFISRVGAKHITILIDKNVFLDHSVVIPENVLLRFQFGNVIYLDNYDLEINGPIEAGLYQIFDTELDYNRDKIVSGKVKGKPEIERVVPQWWGARNDDPGFDSAYAIQEAIDYFKSVYLPPGQYYLYRTLTFKFNSQHIYGENAGMFGPGLSVLRAMENFDGDCILDMKDRDEGYGGHYSRTSNILFQGYASYGRPGPIGILFENTRDSLQIEGCSFRNLRIAFKGSGWIHYISNCKIFQCDVGFEVASTNSSLLEKIHLQTAYSRWGTLKNVTLRDSTIQQGTERQRLDSNQGLECIGRCYLNGVYFEGGNAQIYATEGASVVLENCLLGYTINKSGLWGHYKIYLDNDAYLKVSDSRFTGPSSYLIHNQREVKGILIENSDISAYNFFRSNRRRDYVETIIIDGEPLTR